MSKPSTPSSILAIGSDGNLVNVTSLAPAGTLTAGQHAYVSYGRWMSHADAEASWHDLIRGTAKSCAADGNVVYA